MQASRRKFLQSGPALALLPFPALATRTTGGRVAVLVYLKGGNDGYNTFVPLDNARYRELRPTLAIRREQTLHFSDTHGFNAALKPLLPAWQSRELLLVQGIGQEEVTNQHYRDLEMQYTGASPAEYLAEGWITRALGAARQDSGLGGIAFGDLDIRVSDPMGPFRGERIPALNVVHPSEWLTRRQLTGTQHALNAPARQL
ncbi:MAG TPA: hypothetical protein VFV17_03345, partial [Usitatibacteraceae bacterium]|nr:hypothetical protein [Usitatibacteraceae bacterium]